MNFHWKRFVSLFALICLSLPHFISRAQNVNVGVSFPVSVIFSNAVNYTVNVTNISGLNLSQVVISNSFSSPIVFNAGIPSPVVSFTSTSSNVVAVIGSLFDGEIAQIPISIFPTTTGALTNRISVNSIGIFGVTTNVVTQIALPSADLAVGMTNAASVLVNDPTSIGLSVTNLGSSSISGIFVTNTIPASFKLLSVSPANASFTFSPGNLTWNVGTLAGGVRTQLVATLQPTNAGTFPLLTTVSAGINDTNTGNNSVSNSVTVADVIPSDLSVTVLSQQINRQTGLLEMWARLMNNAATNIPAARVAVTNLATGSWLYNAVGTNAGAPYVSYNTNLAGGESVNLLLEFYVLVRAAISNQPFAYAVPQTSFVASTNASGTNLMNYSLSSGGFLIEFPATIGKTYTIFYSDDINFSNSLAAQPSIVAPATRVQWIDSGPPKTISHPTNASARYYRVVQTQ